MGKVSAPVSLYASYSGLNLDGDTAVAKELRTKAIRLYVSLYESGIAPADFYEWLFGRPGKAGEWSVVVWNWKCVRADMHYSAEPGSASFLRMLSNGQNLNCAWKAYMEQQEHRQKAAQRIREQAAEVSPPKRVRKPESELAAGWYYLTDDPQDDRTYQDLERGMRELAELEAKHDPA